MDAETTVLIADDQAMIRAGLVALLSAEPGLRVLAEAAATGLRRQRFPELPKGDNRPHLRAVLDVEKSLRHNEFGLHENREALAGLPEYWRQVLLLFEAYRQIRYEGRLAHRTLDEMWPVFRDSVRNRWPAHLAGQVRDHDIVGGRTQ